MSSDDGASAMPPVLTGARPARPRWLRLLYLVIVVVYVVEALHSRRLSKAIFAAVWLAVFAVSWWQPSVRVDTDGVHRPGLRRSQRFIGWSQIDSVLRPGSYDTAIGLLRTDGEVVRLAGIPTAEAAQVAAIGGKELKAAPPSATPSRPSMPPRPATQAEEDAGFHRRVTAVQADQKRLAAELDRIRRNKRT